MLNLIIVRSVRDNKIMKMKSIDGSLKLVNVTLDYFGFKNMPIEEPKNQGSQEFYQEIQGERELSLLPPNDKELFPKGASDENSLNKVDIEEPTLMCCLPIIITAKNFVTGFYCKRLVRS